MTKDSEPNGSTEASGLLRFGNKNQASGDLVGLLGSVSYHCMTLSTRRNTTEGLGCIPTMSQEYCYGLPR
jgi:hypothetical protein